MRAQGWYKDPYGLHGERWFSNGSPTRIVCDAGLESEDPPPDLPFSGALVRVPDGRSVPEGAINGNEPGQVSDPGTRGAWEAFVETGGD